MAAVGTAAPAAKRIAIVLDPRFPGGTSSAVAQEIPVLANMAELDLHAVSSAMFKGQDPNPALKTAATSQGLEFTWDAPVISADLIILHNPSFLKFDSTLDSRLVCQNLIAVTHENFRTPAGMDGFDVAGCLRRIEDATLAADLWLAPVSPHNRSTVRTWLDAQSRNSWRLTDGNWFNICDFPISAPTQSPRDRRGRLSRPGYEKFPDRATMDLLFPAHAETNAILGADTLMEGTPPPHWTLHAFRSRTVADFLADIDFFVYFTNPGWRESFGRVLAEATAAGKLVITDPDTASNFGDGIAGVSPHDVDALIQSCIQDPEIYAQHVARAQETLELYSPERFAQQVVAIVSQMSDSGVRTAS